MQSTILRCLPSRTAGRRNDQSKFCRNDKTSNLQQTSLTFWTSSIVSGLKNSKRFGEQICFHYVWKEERKPLRAGSFIMSVCHWTSENRDLFRLSRCEVPKMSRLLQYTIFWLLQIWPNISTLFSTCLQEAHKAALQKIFYFLCITESGDTERDIAIATHPASRSLEYLWLLFRP